MNAHFTISPSSLRDLHAAIARKLGEVRQPVQAAMADTFFGVVESNFGSTGWDRGNDWQRLSPRYAKKVGRTLATLFVTGALKATLQKESNGEGAATVSMGNTGQVPYALAHHHGSPGNFGWTQPGSGDLPARRVFPLNPFNDEVNDRTKRLVEQAAKLAVKGVLS